MGMFDNAVPGGNISKPLMIALGALLAGKMMGSFGSSSPAQTSAPADGGGSTGGGGLLSGGLGGLLDKLKAAGHGETANSWVGSGPNTPIQPGQLSSALGQSTVSDLARHSGMSESDLLQQLSHALPGVVDKLTPGGQIPPQSTIQSHFG